jgi:tRNA-Thr(GGU) m(6)t(6)A37 methyltransferase TsaA
MNEIHKTVEIFMDMKLIPIGIINSQYLTKDDAPHQGRFSTETSTITVFDEFLDGLNGLDTKYLIILYWQDRTERDKLKVIPYGKKEKRGIFSTRAPVRPNPIAFCVVELVDMNRNKLTVKWLDALDGSPLLDIKPFWDIDLPDKD